MPDLGNPGTTPELPLGSHKPVEATSTPQYGARPDKINPLTPEKELPFSDKLERAFEALNTTYQTTYGLRVDPLRVAPTGKESEFGENLSFNPMEQALKEGIQEGDLNRFLTVDTDTQYQNVKQNIFRQYRRQEELEAAGGMGFVAGATAMVLDPTVFIGTTNALGSIATSVSKKTLIGASEGAVVGAGLLGIVGAVDNEGRAGVTDSDMYINMGVGILAGGILGAAGEGLAGITYKSLTKDISHAVRRNPSEELTDEVLNDIMDRAERGTQNAD